MRAGVVLDETAPRAPTGLTATGDGRVVLGWRRNTEPDLFDYKAHRATAPSGPYTALPSAVLSPPL
jgi:hypothetical protein